MHKFDAAKKTTTTEQNIRLTWLVERAGSAGVAALWREGVVVLHLAVSGHF